MNSGVARTVPSSAGSWALRSPSRPPVAERRQACGPRAPPARRPAGPSPLCQGCLRRQVAVHLAVFRLSDMCFEPLKTTWVVSNGAFGCFEFCFHATAFGGCSFGAGVLTRLDGVRELRVCLRVCLRSCSEPIAALECRGRRGTPALREGFTRSPNVLRLPLLPALVLLVSVHVFSEERS